jgi:aldose 1-epimerase
MAADPAWGDGIGPTEPMPPGPLLTLADGALSVDIAPQAGGRIAQIRCDGHEQLVGYGEHGSEAAIAWGSYPMIPWCGRIRDGRFGFDGVQYQLPSNLGAHAIHGVGFLMPWQVVGQGPEHVVMELQLPRDRRWPFGGLARQRIQVRGRSVLQELSLAAQDQALPFSLGWHPWFRKPEVLEFSPRAMYPRDADGMTLLPPGDVPPGPWDDCFVNHAPVSLRRGGQRLSLRSDCSDWVVYDQTAHATCVEPQTAMPDVFNLAPERRLEAGQTASVSCRIDWD